VRAAFNRQLRPRRQVGALPSQEQEFGKNRLVRLQRSPARARLGVEKSMTVQPLGQLEKAMVRQQP
jgi:hypothetical protein